MSMKVTGPGAARGPEKSKKSESATKGEKGEFVSHLSRFIDKEAESGLVEQTGQVTSVDAVLAAQSVDATDPDGRRRRSVQRGERILDLLENVRRGLLIGAIPKDQLADLAQVVREKREAGVDPRLAAVLDEIELRAQVELAKFSRRA